MQQRKSNKYINPKKKNKKKTSGTNMKAQTQLKILNAQVSLLRISISIKTKILI